ncbi:MAG: tetraacyldisaccharide 4'-kinase [Alphaproteobacteria bacterium]
MRNFWKTRGFLAQILRPVAAIYAVGTLIDRMLTTAKHAGIPVISVGNVTAGGAGKTPTTLALAELLAEHSPHILTRGYGAKIVAPLRVNPAQHTAREVGDEALLLARIAPVWAFVDRISSATAARAAGAKILLCDDALQHHALHKDLNLLVMDGGYGIGNGLLLPAGPLREPLKCALARSHAVILIGEDLHGLSAAISLPVFHAALKPAGDTSWLTGTRIIAFAGIARPQKFYATLARLGAEIIATHDFPDHHPYSERELEGLVQAGQMVVTTEKDWVRLTPAWQKKIRPLPVMLQFDEPEKFREWITHALAL